MPQGYELMFRARRIGFSPSLDSMNPEIAEYEELARAARGPGPSVQPRHASHRKLGGAVFALGVAALMLLGSRWGIA